MLRAAGKNFILSVCDFGCQTCLLEKKTFEKVNLIKLCFVTVLLYEIFYNSKRSVHNLTVVLL